MKTFYFILFICFSCIFAFRDDEVPHCVDTPSDPDCKGFKLPDVRKHIDNSCGMMWMPGCTIDNICKDSKYNNTETKNTLCSEFSVLIDLCTDHLMGVGCRHWKKMCQPEDSNSVVDQCKTPNLGHVLPNTKESKQLVEDICNDMPMDGCEKCKPGDGHCDYLEVYSHLCIQMPEMHQCMKWKGLCKVVPNWPLCDPNDNADAPPVMRMYFHTGIKDYVLFKEWVPKSNLGYFGTWVAVFVMGVLFDGLKFIRTRLENKWAQSSEYEKINEHGNIDTHQNKSHATKFRWTVDIPRGFLQALETTWGYFLMLIAMTFNVGLFMAVIAGSFFGAVIFGRFIAYQPKASCH